jgi:hypothetical protein
MSKLVFIMSIPRQTATGISDWVSTSSGLKMKKTKVGRATDSLVALPSQKIGGLANYISYNYKVDPATGQVEKDENGEQITIQTFLEKKWGKPKGFFSNALPPKDYKGSGADLGYYFNKSWQLLDGTTVLDLSKMDDEIGYYVMLASSKVANSEKEWREHKWPKATHYIALENESEEIKYKRTQAKTKAFSFLHDSHLTDSVKQKLIALLDVASSRTKLSTEQIHNLLFDYIDATTSPAGKNIDKFNHYMSLLKTADGKAKFEVMYMLKQAQEVRLVYSKQDIWTWIRESGATLVIGDKYSEAVDFLLNPKKKDEYDELKAQIKAKL